MSWGERSCKFLYDQNKKCEPEIATCNCNCELYEWDGKTAPDSTPVKSDEQRSRMLKSASKIIDEILAKNSI